jgi:hypothetical protein
LTRSYPFAAAGILEHLATLPVNVAIKKRGLGRLIAQAKGGLNTKLHALADTNGRPLSSS